MQIKIWFQNRRTKWKRKYTSDLEIMATHHHLAALQGILQASATVRQTILTKTLLINSNKKHQKCLEGGQPPSGR
jgi:hypothetical protein